MLEYKNGSSTAIIILHEIYGVNNFIIGICNEYSAKNYDVYCPNLIARQSPFDYSQQTQAYEHFINNVGFDVYTKVNNLLEQLKPSYKKIVLLGFSIGATLAWRCADSGLCDAVIGCYGSRIRGYLDITPKCPVLLIFAENEKSFDVSDIATKLSDKVNTTVNVLNGEHGFCDKYSNSYNLSSAKLASELIDRILKPII